MISTTTKRVIDERYPQKKGDDPGDHSLFLGVCSNFMCDLRPGDPIKVTGPNGKRFLLPEPTSRGNHDYVFVPRAPGSRRSGAWPWNCCSETPSQARFTL